MSRRKERQHGLLGEPLEEAELEELAQGTFEDDLAAERIAALLARDRDRLRGKRQLTSEERELLAWIEGVTEEEIREAAKVRCAWCGADPRAPEYTGMEVYGRQLSYPGCCPGGAEELAQWLSETTADDRIEWARALFGPYLSQYGQIAYVTGPQGEVEQRRRGEWTPTDERADPYQVSYRLRAEVVRDQASRKLVSDFVVKYHAHMAWSGGQQWKFGVLVFNGPDLVGVGYVERPGARAYPKDGSWLDVARVAIRRNLPKWVRDGAASLIYSTAWQAASSGEWISDEDWARVKRNSDRRRARIEAAAKAVTEADQPQKAEIEAWAVILGVTGPKTWDKVKAKAAYTIKHPWRLERRAIRLITYTLANEELGTTLKAANWEPAEWSKPHAKPTGARASRGEKAGAKAKIRWQIGLKEHRRRILKVVGKAKHEDQVEVAASPRGQGGVVSTLAPRVYGVETEADLTRRPLFSWQETREELAARKSAGLERRINPLDEESRRAARSWQQAGDRESRTRWLAGLLRAGKLDQIAQLQEQPDLFWQFVGRYLVADLRMADAVGGYEPTLGVTLQRLHAMRSDRVAAIGRQLGSGYYSQTLGNDDAFWWSWWIGHRDLPRPSEEHRHAVQRYAQALEQAGLELVYDDDDHFVRHPWPRPEQLALASEIRREYLPLLRSLGGGRRLGKNPGSGEPRRLGVHKAGEAFLLLDLDSVNSYGPGLWWSRRRPLLAGFKEGQLRVARDGVTFADLPVHAESLELADLARRVGISLAKAESLLVREGRAWAQEKVRERAR